MDRLGGYFGSHEAEDPYDDYVDETDADLDPPPSPVGQDERRMQVRAYNHWASLLGDLNFPHVDDLEPETLDDFGPYSVLLDFTGGIDDPAVRFIGAKLDAECGHEGEIDRLSDVPSRSVLSRITDHYMQIIANQAPIGFEAEFVNDHGTTVLYRGILLPYSSDNATIDFIYGVINWKEMADKKTADELLLEIDAALGADADSDRHAVEEVETAESFTEQAADDGGDVLELGNADMVDSQTPNSMPRPAFGQADEDMDDDALDHEEPAIAARADRSVDALGNPIGSLVEDGYDEDDDFDTGVKTAADYGLPDWDDEPEEEDVDDVVDPLADDDTGSSLVSLVSRGERTKKSVDLSRTEPAPAIPQAYEGETDTVEASVHMRFGQAPEPSDDEMEEAAAPVPQFDEPDFGEPAEFAVVEEDDASDDAPAAEDDAWDLTEEAIAEDDEDAPEYGEYDADQPVVAEAVVGDAEAAPEGLYDCLASARELAQTAQNSEDRSRKALYDAVGRAYDFSLEAQDNPDDYEELLADNGLTFQDRAPMTPVVKLVFGAEYDKTRLTEYAAVLMHAHRVGVERGSLGDFLREAEGGLKGVLNAERRARKEEQGKPVEDKPAVRDALASKLRELEPVDLGDLDEDGAEFALVMVRRTPEGELVVLGEVPEDIPFVERAARKLLG